MKLFQKKRLPKSLAVVGASAQEALSGILQHGFEVREAWSTRGVLDALAESPALVVLDPETLVETPDLSTQVLQGALATAIEDGLQVLTSAQFLAESEHFLNTPPSGKKPARARFLPPRVVLFTNYAGGTGKTTLALSTARHFRQACGLPCGVVEMGLGSSAFQARMGGKLPSLYSLVTQSGSPGEWEGVDLYPLEGREAQVLASDPRLRETLEQITHTHTLTILDAFPGSPLWPLALSLASDIFVVASPRVDALSQTESLLQEIREASPGIKSPPRLHLVLNMVRSLGDRLPLTNQAAVHLPYNPGKAGALQASLAEPLINLLYPSWKAPQKGAKA